MGIVNLVSCRIIQFAIGINAFLIQAYVLLSSVIYFCQLRLCQPHIFIAKRKQPRARALG